jgi:hypothetical protein
MEINSDPRLSPVSFWWWCKQRQTLRSLPPATIFIFAVCREHPVSCLFCMIFSCMMWPLSLYLLSSNYCNDNRTCSELFSFRCCVTRLLTGSNSRFQLVWPPRSLGLGERLCCKVSRRLFFSSDMIQHIS